MAEEEKLTFPLRHALSGVAYGRRPTAVAVAGALDARAERGVANGRCSAACADVVGGALHARSRHVAGGRGKADLDAVLVG